MKWKRKSTNSVKPKKEPNIFQNNIKSKTCKLESNETHQIAGHDLEQRPTCAIGFVPALKIVVRGVTPIIGVNLPGILKNPSTV